MCIQPIFRISIESYLIDIYGLPEALNYGRNKVYSWANEHPYIALGILLALL